MTTQEHKGTALVTGASSGLGALYAERLARRGHDLVLVARNRGRLDTLATRLAGETGRKVEVIVADLTDDADLRRVEQRLQTDEGISMLVNNAGFGAASPLLESDADRLESMIKINVVALTRLTRAVAPAMVRRGKGVILNISSIVALAPELLNGTYAGSKAYVLSFTQSLHHELGPKGIQVQAVLPGATRTEFWGVAGVPIGQLPAEWVMAADEMVDAALAGLDQKELVTIPSLPDVGEWEHFEAARLALGSKLSRAHPAERYKS